MLWLKTREEDNFRNKNINFDNSSVPVDIIHRC